MSEENNKRQQNKHSWKNSLQKLAKSLGFFRKRRTKCEVWADFLASLSNWLHNDLKMPLTSQTAWLHNGMSLSLSYYADITMICVCHFLHKTDFRNMKHPTHRTTTYTTKAQCRCNQLLRTIHRTLVPLWLGHAWFTIKCCWQVWSFPGMTGYNLSCPAGPRLELEHWPCTGPGWYIDSLHPGSVTPSRKVLFLWL